MVLCLYINKTETETGKYKKDKDRNIKVNVHLTAFGFEVESSISGIDSFQSGPIPPSPIPFPHIPFHIQASLFLFKLFVQRKKL